MANFLATGSDLTTVANAIRAKAHISDRLVWPNGYVTAINNIPASGDKSMRSAHVYVEHNMTGYLFNAKGRSRKVSSGSIIIPTGLSMVYDSSIPFGSSASKVITALARHDEAAIAASMTAWNAAGACYYDSENLFGACGGYSSEDDPIPVTSVNLYIGRAVNQNTNLIVTFQYLDENGTWHDIKDILISTTLSYPLNVERIDLPAGLDIYGVRWIHTKAPLKTKNNNICFFGMIMRT